MQNILICQDLVRLYNRNNSTKSYLIKVDIRKAYDTVEWEFVQEKLYALNFRGRFIRWVMAFITITQYTLALNGGMYDKIIGKRELR